MQERIAITGAAGWLGRELAYALSNSDSPVLLLGRRGERLNLGQLTLTVHEWTHEKVSDWKPTMIVHLAYMTRERLTQMGEHDFRTANLALRERIDNALTLPSVHTLVHASSGASQSPNGHDAYADLKRADESAYEQLAADKGVGLVNARAWSLSGRFCTKRKEFLFFDVIDQVVSGQGFVVLKSPGQVWRKYVDAGEYLYTCVTAAADGYRGTIDSTGDLVEAAQLTKEVATVAGTRIEIRQPHKNRAALNSLYYSTSTTMDELMAKYHVERALLPEQILRSLRPWR